MARQRSSTGWSYTFFACTTQSIHAHRMKASPMASTATTYFSISQLAKTPFRWGLDSNHYVPLMWLYHLKLLKQICLMSSLKLIGLTNSLSVFNTSTISSMSYLTETMLSTSNDMINISCHTSSRWTTKFGYICRRSASLGPTASFSRSDMGHTPSPRF